MTKPTRRQFLQTSTTVLLGATAMQNRAAGQSGKNLVACRDAHLSVVEAPDVWQAAKQTGLEGMEVWVNDERQCSSFFGVEPIHLNNEEHLKRLQALIDEHGVQITAFALGNRFDERLAFEIDWLRDVVHACQVLGVKAIRIDVVPRAIRDEDEFLKFFIKMGTQIVELIENTPVSYGIENHGGTTNKPEFLEALFDGVGSEKLGLTLDTANFYWFGHPLDKLYEIYEKFASRTYHTHCKSINYPPEKRNVQRERGWKYGQYASPIYDGDIDFNKVLTILREANYTGDLCIENESLGRFSEDQRGEVLHREAEFLQQLL